MTRAREFRFEETKDTPLGRTTDAAMARFKTLGYEPEDFIQHFPCFASPKLLARFLSLFECYQKTLGLSGHIAEVGVYRGAASMFFAKLLLLYEPQGITQVHGFDWFRAPEGVSDSPDARVYYEPYERIRQIVDVQGLQRYLLLHQINVITELSGFFQENSHLQFKLVFLDAGDYQIVAECIREFWPRLTKGGIMIFDQYNHEVAPGETQAVKELLPDEIVRTFPQGWIPTAYIIKGEGAGLAKTQASQQQTREL